LARVAVAVAVIAAASLAWLHPWTRPAPAPPNYRAFTQVTGVQLLSATTAFVLTQSTESPGHFIGYATTDGGKDWRRFGVPPTSDIHFVDALHGFGATEGSLLASADGGRSWEARTLPPGQRFAGAAWFLDADHGWYLNLEVLSGTGLPRDMYRTQDGGRTWQPVATRLPAGAWLASSSYLDPEHGWALGGGGNLPFATRVLRTADGGGSWTPVAGPWATS
jgi:photosystem II stability/assembly factor-like uncharacterized protein